jgi:uncharacterized membrane protein YebE (DUF533 family)
MDESRLINGVLRSVLGGRGRRSSRALRYLSGGRGSSLWANPQVLLTAAGVAWGIFETMKPPAHDAPSGSGPAGGVAAVSPPPPLPDPGGAATPVTDQTLRIVRLAVSAAYADGAVSEAERAAILEQARAAGVGDLVEQELTHPRPLAEVVGGVSDAAERAALYVLAYGILRGDEQPSGAERIYLAKLAHLLGLDPATIEDLERNAGRRIDAQE